MRITGCKTLVQTGVSNVLDRTKGNASLTADRHRQPGPRFSHTVLDLISCMYNLPKKWKIAIMYRSACVQQSVYLWEWCKCSKAASFIWVLFSTRIGGGRRHLIPSGDSTGVGIPVCVGGALSGLSWPFTVDRSRTMVPLLQSMQQAPWRPPPTHHDLHCKYGSTCRQAIHTRHVTSQQ